MAEPMTLQIITPDAIVFEGQSTFFVGKAIDGGFGILPNHAPMIIALDLAPLRIEQPDGTSREYAVFGGFCEIEHNKVSIATCFTALACYKNVIRKRLAIWLAFLSF